MARPGSPHGYDVTDHSRFNPEIGDDASFSVFPRRCRATDMGLIADVVPNHMCITHPSNVWWWDVLENGPSSPFARYFDIDWHPPKEELVNKVLLPMLGINTAVCWRIRRSRSSMAMGNFTLPFTKHLCRWRREPGPCFWSRQPPGCAKS